MQPSLANIFQPLVNVFEAILKFFHDDIGLGWGLAIIALTVLIRSLLLPLTLKQLRSMYRMAQFTPEIRKLRDKTRLGPAAPSARDDGVLQGEQDQPARVAPACGGAAAGLPLGVLHAAHRSA